MDYLTRFYCPCPDTGKEIFVEVHFFRDEFPADRLEYWGSLVALPPTNEVHLTAVFRDGKTWEDYPNSLEEEIYSHHWEPNYKRA